MSSSSPAPFSPPVRRESPLSLGIFVGILLGVVLVPLGMAMWPVERARWLIAQAANHHEFSPKTKDEWKKTQEILDRARSIDRGVATNANYLALRLMAGPLNAERANSLIEEVPDAATKSQLAMISSEIFFENKDVETAFDVLKQGLPPLAARNATQNNQFAYFASLVGSELDEALASIENALKVSEDSTFLDTKAWVLFQLGDFKEALVAIDAAIELNEVELKKIPLKTSDRKKLKAFVDDGEKVVISDEEVGPNVKATRDVVQHFAKVIAIYRYHRAEILKKLDRVEDAEQEYAWLRQRGFEDFDELY